MGRIARNAAGENYCGEGGSDLCQHTDNRENGTGKDLLAREIHRLSKRSGNHIETVDMGAVIETLFESELYGYVKGAFTDARADRAGKFETAHNGTLFLDEIGNLPYHLQAKLLTSLQQRRIVRVGSNTPIGIDIRLICATNKDLPRMVEDGQFRQDLFYRINTVTIELPHSGTGRRIFRPSLSLL